MRAGAFNVALLAAATAGSIVVSSCAAFAQPTPEPRWERQSITVGPTGGSAVLDAALQQGWEVERTDTQTQKYGDRTSEYTTYVLRRDANKEWPTPIPTPAPVPPICQSDPTWEKPGKYFDLRDFTFDVIDYVPSLGNIRFTGVLKNNCDTWLYPVLVFTVYDASGKPVGATQEVDLLLVLKPGKQGDILKYANVYGLTKGQRYSVKYRIEAQTTGGSRLK